MAKKRKENRKCENPNCGGGFRAPKSSKKRYCNHKCAQSDPKTIAKVQEGKRLAKLKKEKNTVILTPRVGDLRISERTGKPVRKYRYRKPTSSIRQESDQFYFMIDAERGTIYKAKSPEEAQQSIDRFISEDNDIRDLVIIKGEKQELKKKYVI